MRVVIIRECAQLSRQVDRVPEEQVIEIFAADGADQPFNERMRNRGVRNRLDLVGGEFPIKRQSGSGTERGNAAAKRDSQARQEQV